MHSRFSVNEVGRGRRTEAPMEMKSITCRTCTMEFQPLKMVGLYIVQGTERTCTSLPSGCSQAQNPPASPPT